VVEVAEELVEPVISRQHLVAIAEVILAELADIVGFFKGTDEFPIQK
jgi:hypothetical protein